MMKEQPYRVLTVITALWVVGMLFVRVPILAMQIGGSFLTAVRYFLPEIAVAAILLLLLPAVGRRERWIPSALVALAALLLVLLVATGFSRLWFVSFLLLLLLAYAVRPAAQDPLADPAHPTMWLFLILSKAPMYLGTPGAYLQLSAGALGAVEGFRQGHWSLATALLIGSLLGLYGLWTMWSISTRTWAHDRYVVHSDNSRMKDALGLLAAWIAAIGLAATSTSIFRGEEMIVFSVLLMPSLLVTTVIAGLMAPEIVEKPGRIPLSDLLRRAQAKHYAGMICGLAFGLLGVTFLMPPTHSGWGPCDWTIMFPIEGNLWPVDRGMVFDACSTGPGYQTVLLAVASFVFWMSGLLTSVVGRSTDAWLGAVTAAVTALVVLAWRITARVIAVLALPLDPLPPISTYINWVSTIGIGIAIVLWAARLGYLGGRRASRSAEPQPVSAEKIGPEVR